MTAKWGAPIEEERAGRSVVEPIQPGRWLLRLAGLFTQLSAAGCLLLGTIAFVLIQQNNSGGGSYVIAWGGGAMVALVFGGLMVRGGLISLLIAALLDISFGSVLLVIDKRALAGMLRVLSGDDVEMVADILFIAALSLIGIGLLCFLSIPQAIRYGRWLHAGESGQLSTSDVHAAASTNRGFPPPPVPASASMWIMPVAPVAERRSRRRLYFALGGFAIGFGAGIGVLLSSTTRRSQPVDDTVVTPSKPSTPDKPTTKIDKPPEEIATNIPDAGSGSSATKTEPPAPPPTTTVQAMLQEQRAAIARGDLDAVIATLAPEAIGFGIDANELALDRTALAAQIKRDLGEHDGTQEVEVKFTHVGQEGSHAWIAQELELSTPGKPLRKFAVTMLAAHGNAGWQVVAWHWAVPVRDEVAEKVAILGTKPGARPIPNKTIADKDLDKAVRDAFGSRQGFAGSRSEREDGFNFGSGPQERIIGGSKVKSIFGKLRAEIKLHDNTAYILGVSPTVGVALVNADFTHKTRAATDMTQTFRVLAVLLKEGSEWKLVLTQWSHGGPIRN